MKRKQFQRVTPVILLLICLLAACATPATAPNIDQPEAPSSAVTEEATAAESLFPLTITDAAGQEFTFDAPPKLGCLWTGCIEIFADLNTPPYAGDSWLEEVYDSVLFFPAGPPTHTITDSYNPEDWAKAEVDLILMRLPVSPNTEALAAAAPLFYLHAPSFDATSVGGYQAYLENIRLVGQLIDQPTAAEQAIAHFDRLVTSLHQLATPETAALTVAVLWEDEAFRAVDHTNPFCAVIQETGLGTCIEAPLWEEINPEAFLAIDPDLILVMQETDTFAERANPVWAQLSAVKNGNVYGVEGLYYCCGARALYYDLHEYAHIILPDVVADPGPTADYDPAQSPLIQPIEPAATAAESGETRTVTHALGETTIPANPQRILAMGEEWLLADLLALGVKPVASTVNLPDAVPGISPEDLAGIELFSSQQVNLETLAELQPDLIIGNRYFVESAGYDLLSQLAPTIALSNTVPLPAYLETAAILGREESAQAQIDSFQADVTRAAEQLGDDQPTVTVATIYAGPSLAVWATGPTSVPQALLDLGFTLRPDPAVLDDALAANGRAWLSMEQLILLDGEQLILLQSSAIEGEDAAVAEIQSNPLWATLPAVQNEQVHTLDRLGYPGFTGQQRLLADLLVLFQE